MGGGTHYREELPFSSSHSLTTLFATRLTYAGEYSLQGQVNGFLKSLKTPTRRIWGNIHIHGSQVNLSVNGQSVLRSISSEPQGFSHFLISPICRLVSLSICLFILPSPNDLTRHLVDVFHRKCVAGATRSFVKAGENIRTLHTLQRIREGAKYPVPLII